MQRIVRRVFWVVMAGMLVVAMIAANAKANSLAGPLVLAMIGWWFLGVIPSRWIAASLLTKLRCKNCGLEIPAINKWRIGSYQDHRERHIVFAKSPIDGTRIGNLPCPQCSATILV